MSAKQRYYPKHRRFAIPGPSPLPRAVSQPNQTVIASITEDSGERFDSSILINAASGSADIVALGDVRMTSMTGSVTFYNQDTAVASVKDDALIVTGGSVDPESVDPNGDVAVFVGDVSASRLRLRGREVKITEIYHLWSNTIIRAAPQSFRFDGIRDVTNYGSVSLVDGKFVIVPGTYEIQIKTKIPACLVDSNGNTVYLQNFNGITHFEMTGILVATSETLYSLECRQEFPQEILKTSLSYSFVRIVKID